MFTFNNDNKGKIENLRGFAIMQNSNPFQKKSVWRHHTVFIGIAVLLYVIAAHAGVV